MLAGLYDGSNSTASQRSVRETIPFPAIKQRLNPNQPGCDLGEHLKRVEGVLDCGCVDMARCFSWSSWSHINNLLHTSPCQPIECHSVVNPKPHPANHRRESGGVWAMRDVEWWVEKSCTSEEKDLSPKKFWCFRQLFLFPHSVSQTVGASVHSGSPRSPARPPARPSVSPLKYLPSPRHDR